MDLSIGDMERLTGLPVKTIRYYSDIGLVREAGRTAAGYRRYDERGLALLELVRSLRDLGLELKTIHRVVERPASLEEIARAHADAIDVHIRQLVLRRAVLRAIARGSHRPEEVRRMTNFAHASADEVRRIMEDFLEAVFDEQSSDPFAERMRAALPVLPERPTNQQIDAWIELATLVGDPEFRARVRNMVIEGARERSRLGISHTDEATQKAGKAVVAQAGAALTAGIAPGAPEAASIVDQVVGLFAAAAGRADDPGYRSELVNMLGRFSDGRVERYWQLVGIINELPARPSLMPAYEWFIAALCASNGEGVKTQFK